jgi:hypothetical protein
MWARMDQEEREMDKNIKWGGMKIKQELETAEVLYEDFNGKKHSKEIKIPKIRYGMGITKQREGYVAIGYFSEPLYTVKQGYVGLHRRIKEIRVTLPKSTVSASARLKIGKRIVSKAA